MRALTLRALTLRALTLRALTLGGVSLLALLTVPAPLPAHTFAPSLLELREEASGVAVRFKQPRVRVAGSRLVPLLPPACQTVDGPVTHSEGLGVVTTWRLTCGELVGEEIAVDGIAASRADLLLRMELADGRTVHHVLTADRPTFTIPRAASGLDVAGLYGRLGADHILGGFDHLLFVFGLVLLIEGRRRLVATVTAFTAGHSITLALAALGLVFVPQGPTEVAIALSIVVLAVELSRPRGAGSRLRRSPWVMAALFGLLHGLGFAGALTEIGLPEREIPSALLAFNLGIELGQLAFVAVVLVAGALIERLTRPSWRPVLTRAPAYAIGTLATFWLLERLTGMFRVL
ncbi:MAG: HupE/UreJ family protein [Acidobacteriota bacterium]